MAAKFFASSARRFSSYRCCSVRRTADESAALVPREGGDAAGRAQLVVQTATRTKKNRIRAYPREVWITVITVHRSRAGRPTQSVAVHALPNAGFYSGRSHKVRAKRASCAPVCSKHRYARRTRTLRRRGPSCNGMVTACASVARMLGVPRSRSAHGRLGAGGGRRLQASTHTPIEFPIPLL